MCIVIDINTLSHVFNPEDKEYPEFYHVKIWIEKKWGCLVLGGSKFKSELFRTQKYLKIIRLLKDNGNAFFIDDSLVDALELELIEKTKGLGCNDQHILALLATSRCPLFCSQDRAFYPFVKMKSIYLKKGDNVRIYSSSRNVDLLTKIDPKILQNVV
jgi:hypothetical protein